MLNSQSAWSSERPFPAEEHKPCYCIVTEDRVCNFILYPERSVYYRADLAALLHFDASDITITPSDPRQEDAACFGRSSRAVVAVGRTGSRGRSQSIICIFDCRPLLWGWRRVVADDGWRDLNRIYIGFATVIPRGWTIQIGAHHSSRSWAQIWTGQVLVLRPVPCPQPSEAFGSPAPAHTSDPTEADGEVGHRDAVSFDRSAQFLAASGADGNATRYRSVLGSPIENLSSHVTEQCAAPPASVTLEWHTSLCHKRAPSIVSALPPPSALCLQGRLLALCLFSLFVWVQCATYWLSWRLVSY